MKYLIFSPSYPINQISANNYISNDDWVEYQRKINSTNKPQKQPKNYSNNSKNGSNTKIQQSLQLYFYQENDTGHCVISFNYTQKGHTELKSNQFIFSMYSLKLLDKSYFVPVKDMSQQQNITINKLLNNLNNVEDINSKEYVKDMSNKNINEHIYR